MHYKRVHDAECDCHPSRARSQLFGTMKRSKHRAHKEKSGGIYITSFPRSLLVPKFFEEDVEMMMLMSIKIKMF